MSIVWPSTQGALLVWSELLLAWVVALYYTARTTSVWGRVEPERSPGWIGPALLKLLLLVVVAIVAVGRRPVAALVLVLLGGGLALALSYARERGPASWKSRGAELELGVTGAYVVGSALVVGDRGVRPLLSLLTLPLSESRQAALLFAAAITLFLVRGGTQVVRAILNRAGSLPTVQHRVDEVEYNRGRLIGSMERLILAWMVAAGSYAAMGFIVAAKGLVRSRQFDSHDFAEYFLVGTLASTALALVAGGLLRVIFEALW